MSADITVTPSSGNVFAALNLPNPEEHLGKATIALSLIDRLLRSMRKLDYDVTISFKPKPRAKATINIKGAPLSA